MRKSFLTTVFTAFTALILGACTQVGVGIANLPSKFSDTTIKKDIAYGGDDLQKLDLYIPPMSDNKKLPVIVFFYGGGWTDGSKNMYDFVGDALAKRGFIVAVADYRKYPDAKFPEFVEDGAKAIAWTYKNIEKFGGDQNNLFVSGHSAGAHTGALVSVNEKYLKAEGFDNTKVVKGFVGLSGPYDFVPEAAKYKEIFGPPSNYPNMQVTTFVKGNEAPMLLLWGGKDTIVYKSNSDKLAAAINKKDGYVELKTYPNLDHVGMVSSFTWFLKSKAPIINDITEFFNKYRTQT